MEQGGAVGVHTRNPTPLRMALIGATMSKPTFIYIGYTGGIYPVDVDDVSKVPESWNTCPTCKGPVDADEVFDGSEVRCRPCDKRLVVVESVGLDGSSAWGLREIGDSGEEDESEE